ncbi:MAG: GC-type dockerin domain-anchored protein, partial [Phycisphaerales bacterium]
FSQYGNGLDLTAPGTSIFTTDRSGTAGYNMSSTDGDYTSFGGTSSAAPVAAGTAALALSSKPWLSAGAMETDLYHSTIDRGTAGYDTTYGWGIINAYNFMVYYFETQVNDACGNATNLGSGTNVTWSQNVTSAIDDAVAEPQESCEAGNVGVFHSVWYRWTAPTFGTINLDTIGSNYDTVLSVWDGCGVYNSASDTLAAPTQMGCNDDISGSNLASSVSNVRVKTGQTVRIKVSRYGRGPVTSINSLSATLHLTFTPGPPTNNACNTAEPMTFVDVGGSLAYESPLWDTSLAQNLTGCAQETAASCVFASTKPVWWTFTAPGDGVMLFQTYESNYDTVLSIYSGCGHLIQIGVGGQTICSAPTQNACSDDLEPGTLWSNIPNFNVLAGQTYKVRLAGYGAASTGGLARLRAWFSAVNYPAPANDACTNATVIPPESTSFTDSVSNMGATTAGDCGDPPANTVGTVTSRSVWWTFTPPTDGVCSIDTLTSTFDTTMSIYDATYTGCAARDGNNVCIYPNYVTYDEDSGSGFTSVISGQPLVSGHVYLFRVAGYSTGSRGTVNFAFSFSPTGPMPPANDAWVAALPMPSEGGTAFTSGPIDTRAATSDTDCGDGILACTADPLGNSIWFTITPDTDGFLDANTFSSDFDTVLAVFDASGGGPTRDELGNCIYPSEIACNDNLDEVTLQSVVSATLLRGHTYLVAVFAKDAGGQAVLDSAYTAACTADLAGFGGNIGPDHLLTVDDLVYFLSAFFGNDPRADIATTGGTLGADGQMTVDDLVTFLQYFFSNCP